jgi:hypothetical protein
MIGKLWEMMTAGELGPGSLRGFSSCLPCEVCERLQNNSTIPFCCPYPQRAIYPMMSALVAKITLAADEILKGFLVEESSAQNQSLLRKSLDHGVQHSRSRALPRDATKEWPILSISQQ